MEIFNYGFFKNYLLFYYYRNNGGNYKNYSLELQS